MNFRTKKQIHPNDIDDLGAEVMALFDEPISSPITIMDVRGGSGNILLEYEIPDRRTSEERRKTNG